MQLYPQIVPQLEFLLSYQKIRFVATNFEKSHPSAPFCDRFLLEIPYCGKKLKWMILYNSDALHLAPDVLLPDGEEFIANLSSISMPALGQWDITNQSDLLAFILDLLSNYKEYHKCKVATVPSERVQFEFNTLCEESDASFLAEEDRVVFHLPFALPEPHQAAVVAEFRPQEDRLSSLNLDFPEHIMPFRRHITAKLPRLQQNECLANYLPQARTSLIRALNELERSRKARAAFFRCFAQHIGRPLESDTKDFRKMMFFAKDTFVFVIMSAQFPEQPPSIVLQSCTQLYTTRNEETGALERNPRTKSLSLARWNAQWTMEEMVQRVRSELVHFLKEFRAK
eukprot:gnl/Trimastix_PCT/2881.p1 GENE.gnl/Trimastix_PCT/2881~~gnl/Trimastix_PCT/2881.p1  ORF type:complete len:341 (+),score=67.59 gnl/Trimastix_PCT/2881:74-1096(+)